MKLIIVNSVFNLLVAVQLRLTYLKDDEVDIIISDETPSFHHLYNRNVLQNVFTNIYFAEVKKYQVNKKKFFFPQYALSEILKESPKSYSDIFFWNPDFIIYNYYKWYKTINFKVIYHLYGDAMSSYILDAPDGNKNDGMYVGNKKDILNFLDKWLFGYTRIADLNYDYYIFKKEMFLKNTNRNLISIPTIDLKNKNILRLYNEIYDYHNYFINQKYIYLDTARDGYITNEDVLGILKILIEYLGRENIIVKPHPRVEEKIYMQLGIEVFDRNVPWEIYCMNNQMSNKIVFCSLTSAAVMPYILFEKKYEIVSVCDMIPNTHPHLIDLKMIYEIINKREHNIKFIPDRTGLIRYLEKLVIKESEKC